MKRTIYSEIGLQNLIGELRQAFKGSGYLRASFSAEKDRTASQNSISHVWYAQIAAELREDTEYGVKCECKLRYGVPILRADDEDFRQLYDIAIKPLPYEKKLKAIGLIPVTSIMTVGQLTRYLDCMREGYKGRVELEFPQEMARAA